MKKQQIMENHNKKTNTEKSRLMVSLSRPVLVEFNVPFDPIKTHGRMDDRNSNFLTPKSTP